MKRLCLGGFSLLGLCATALSAEPIFSDHFSDGNRDGWLKSSTVLGLDASGNALEIDPGQSVQTFFGSAVELELGDSISLDFQVSFSEATDTAGGFRFGLFDSNGSTTPTEDGNTFYSSYDGIIVATNPARP